MRKTKIDWADYSWNPISGGEDSYLDNSTKSVLKRFSGDIRLNKAATNKYEYDKELGLYSLDKPFKARADKVLNYPFGIEPTYHKYRLDRPQGIKKKSNVAVGAMGEIFGDWIPDKWIEEIFKASEKAPHHNYLFLTRNPRRYIELAEKEILRTGDNYWYGSITATPDDTFFWHDSLNTFAVIDPMIEKWPEADEETIKKVDWIIIGAETRGKKESRKPKKEWVKNILSQSRAVGIPAFLRGNLKDLMGDDFQQEIPEALRDSGEVPKGSALYDKLNDSCGVCKTVALKSEMVAILARRGRGASAKNLTYLCNRCLWIWCTTNGIEYPEMEEEQRNEE